LWCYDAYIMMVRTQLSLTMEQHRRARRRAEELGISMAEYVRRLVDADLKGLSQPVKIDAVFDLGDSGGSDVEKHKDEYVGQAVSALHERRRKPTQPT
jgi:hypothetical protein